MSSCSQSAYHPQGPSQASKMGSSTSKTPSPTGTFPPKAAGSSLQQTSKRTTVVNGTHNQFIIVLGDHPLPQPEPATDANGRPLVDQEIAASIGDGQVYCGMLPVRCYFCSLVTLAGKAHSYRGIWICAGCYSILEVKAVVQSTFRNKGTEEIR